MVATRIELRAVTRENLAPLVCLRLRADQRNWVAPNEYSIAQASLYDTWEARAVHATIGGHDELVGFVLWGQDEDLPDDAPERTSEWWLVRLMIDARWQRRGFGRAAAEAVVAELESRPGCTAVLLGVHPHNAPARALYESMGFVDTGLVEHGEIVMRRPRGW